jgi:DcmR-like sensory protein
VFLAKAEVIMETNDRSVQVAGSALGRHRHICAFFNSLDEQHRVLRSFVTDGLEQGEKVIHIVDPARREEHLKRFRDAGIDVERAMDSGQLDVRIWRGVYLHGGHFDQDRALAAIEELLRSGAAAGYTHSRLLGQVEWALLEGGNVDDLLEYETRVNSVIYKYDQPAMCAYDISRLSASVVIDILRTHPAVIIGGVLQENPYYVPPDEFLLEIRERRSVRDGVRMAH